MGNPKRVQEIVKLCLEIGLTVEEFERMARAVKAMRGNADERESLMRALVDEQKGAERNAC